MKNILIKEYIAIGWDGNQIQFIGTELKAKEQEKTEIIPVTYPGEKVQIDVKYVPLECKTKELPKDKKYYQYTCIDEASRERYLYWYEEHTPMNTVDFVQRCIKYYGYKAKEIQTDNGIEFTYNQAEIKKIHPMDKILDRLKIKHHKIRPRQFGF